MGGKVSFPRQPLDRDRTIIVTGGNTGIGYETAKWIAFLGAKVIIACRSEDRANEAIAKMKTEFKVEKEKKTEGIISDDDIDVQFMQLNLGSLASTKRFIDEFLNSGRKLHVLVCNAGIALHAQEYTEDGNELMFQVNFLGHLLITLYFIPLMLQNGSDDCRIVFVSSYAHTLAEFGVDKIQGRHLTKSNFDRLKYYGNSKLYQVMQMLYMNRKLKDTNVTLSALHPGTVDTEITRSFQDLGLWKFFVGASKMFGASKTPLQGAETVINAAINPELKGIRDKYYQNCKPASISSIARNTKNQDELMKFSLDLLKDHATEEMIKEWTPGGS